MSTTTDPADELRRAQADLAAYDRAVERIRPWMEGTDRTLGEALEAMRAAGIDTSEVVACVAPGEALA